MKEMAQDIWEFCREIVNKIYENGKKVPAGYVIFGKDVAEWQYQPVSKRSCLET